MTFPRREVGALEEGVLQDALDAAQRLDHVKYKIMPYYIISCHVMSCHIISVHIIS